MKPFVLESKDKSHKLTIVNQEFFSLEAHGRTYREEMGLTEFLQEIGGNPDMCLECCRLKSVISQMDLK